MILPLHVHVFLMSDFYPCTVGLLASGSFIKLISHNLEFEEKKQFSVVAWFQDKFMFFL